MPKRASNKRQSENGRSKNSQKARNLSGIDSPSVEADQNSYVFKDGLYYPFIDITDEAWLKTAVLYWDSITTIVPEGHTPYYQTKTSQALEKQEFLIPEFVGPSMSVLDAVAQECIEFLTSPQGIALRAEANSPSPLHSDEQWHSELIHHNKFGDRLRRDFKGLGLKFEKHEDWVRVPSWFARYYMTLLATKIAYEKRLSILTNDSTAEPLANRAARGNVVNQAPADIAQCLLATLVLKTIHINADAPLQRLLNFKEKHSKKLGKLRTALRELVAPLKDNIDLPSLRKHLDTILTDQVEPSIEDLRHKLENNRLTCGYNNLKLSTVASASPTVLGTLLGTTFLGPFALLAGVSSSIVLSIVNYRAQKRGILQDSHYSYLLLAEQELR